MQLRDVCCFLTKRLCACYLLVPTDRPLWPKYSNCFFLSISFPASCRMAAACLWAAMPNGSGSRQRL
jgi:hypothetical protein